MDSQCSRQPDWQVALAHHQNLRTERYKSIEKHFDNIEKLLRVTIGLILAGYFVVPALIFALLKFF